MIRFVPLRSFLLFFLLLLSLSPFPLLSQDTSFIFIQLSDPQFGMYPTGKDFAHERENVAKAVEAINRLKPDFVVVTGDLLNSREDPRQLAAFREEFGKIDSSIALYLVPGNHDVGNIPTDSSLQRYRKDFGPDYYSFERHGVWFIVLNSSLIKDGSKATREARKQDDWLRELLTSDVSRLPAVPYLLAGLTVVLQHHPWFIDNVNEPDSYENLPGKTRKQYLDTLLEHGVTHVFAGHLHRNAQGSYKSLEMVASGPIGMPLGTDPAGLRIVRISKKGIKHRYYGLNEVEKMVKIRTE